jgi:signal transduction histidine kinase
MLSEHLVTNVFIGHDDSNALKFTSSGGHVQVKAYFISENGSADSSNSDTSAYRVVPTTTTTREEGKVRIEILDTGPGISEVSQIRSRTY